MADVIECPKCGGKLRVPDEMAGKRVKCPKCAETFTAGGGKSEPPPSEEKPAKKTSSISERLSDMQKKAPRRSERAEREDDYEEDERPRRRSRRDEDDEDERRPARRRYREGMDPHRGSLILVLGIVSLTMAVLAIIGFCCAPLGLTPVLGLPLGIVAWVLGHKDLRRIDAGEMDPEGRGTTVGGWICGIIGTILNALIVIAIIVIIVIYGAFFLAIFQSMPKVPTGPGGRPPQKLERLVVPPTLQAYLPGSAISTIR
jgi:predicted Zn finger-like uncharacterized protein